MAELPRWWLADNPFATHTSNAMNLLFPEGERFFIRSVKRHLDQIDDPVLRARCQTFFKQESEHGRAHQHSFEILEDQGLEVASFLEVYERRQKKIESNAPAILALSATVALEHLTATLGENALVDDFLERAHPAMTTLLRWHAAEEIEHKSVAFDVLRHVNPSYWVRMAGMVIDLSGFVVFFVKGTKHLLRQEPLSREEIKEYRRQIQEGRGDTLRTIFWRSIRSYLKPGFHPDQNDNYHLAQDYLATAAL